MEMFCNQSRHWFGRAVIFIGLAVPVLSYLFLQVTGSIMVIDTSSSVESVVVSSGDGRHQRLQELQDG
jgi:hypothetical protein